MTLIRTHMPNPHRDEVSWLIDRALTGLTGHHPGHHPDTSSTIPWSRRSDTTLGIGGDRQLSVSDGASDVTW
jgi:hypothetical protein